MNMVNRYKLAVFNMEDCLDKEKKKEVAGSLELLLDLAHKEDSKSPNLEWHHVAGTKAMYSAYRCPRCRYEFGDDLEYIEYCPKCGQKIDNSIYFEEE